jgi:hypothetical protein
MLLMWHSQVRLVPRFAVEQGLQADGTLKIRPVDHMSWSHSAGRGRKRTKATVKAESINGHYKVPWAIRHDHLDDLLATMRMHVEMIGEARFFSFVCSVFGRVPSAVGGTRLDWR